MINRIIDIIRRLWAIPFLRFLVVGAVNTVFGYSIFALFILLQLHYVLAALLMTICGSLFNFKTHGIIVFENKDNRMIFRFFYVYLFIYLLNIGLLKLFDMAGVMSIIAQAIIILPLAILSFFLMRKLVFNVVSKKYRG